MFGNLAERLFGAGRSKARAKSRLHFVLVQDRTGLGADEMSRFKQELVAVMERYFVIDKSALDVSYEREGGTSTLLINSPVVVRRQEAVGGAVGARHQIRPLRSKKRRRRRMRPLEATAAS